MGMLCIFVGDIFQFFREGDTGKNKVTFKVLFESVLWRATLQATHLAVLMGLGSKLPCASRDACFSSVAPKLASTKSGGRAPAMAHRHALAILKSSASYFCKHTHTKGMEGQKKKGFICSFRYGVNPVEHSQEEDNGR